MAGILQRSFHKYTLHNWVPIFLFNQQTGIITVQFLHCTIGKTITCAPFIDNSLAIVFGCSLNFLSHITCTKLVFLPCFHILHYICIRQNWNIWLSHWLPVCPRGLGAGKSCWMKNNIELEMFSITRLL